jgi:hypothetical protein
MGAPRAAALRSSSMKNLLLLLLLRILIPLSEAHNFGRHFARTSSQENAPSLSMGVFAFWHVYVTDLACRRHAHIVSDRSRGDRLE